MKHNHSIFKTFFLSLCILANTHFAYGQTASILPPAKTTFFDSNGKPLTSGTVDFYIPGQTVRKTTWQDAAETTPNTNPVVLDAAGRALILGSGSYRQVVKDRLGNLIWDQVTSSTGSGGGGGPTATGDGDLVGTIKPWAGMSAPNQYMFTYGQQVSRTTYSVLFIAITSAQPVFCTSGNPTLTGLSDTTNFWIGMTVEATCLAAGSSTIISKTSSTVTLAANPNVTSNITAIFFPWGNGNGSTTFNIPDFRGFAIAGNNNMGGVANSVLTTTYFGAATPNATGAAGGSQSTFLSTTNLPSQPAPSGTVASSITFNSQVLTAASLAANTGVNSSGNPQYGNANTLVGTVTSTFTGSALTGQNATPFSIVQPTKMSNYIIKVTPDSNSATASGVTSIQGMTGDIACGTGLTCTGNVISANSGSGSGTAGQIAYFPTTGTSFTGTSAITISGGIATATTPIIDTSITWNYSGTTVGTQSLANPAAVTPSGSAIWTYQGATVGGTSAIHLIPASGPLIGTVTTSEYVLGATLSQAFGGNYGRWSYSNFANTISGIVGEYGGTVTPPVFDLQIGIENPPSVFTSIEFWRAQTTNGGSEDAQQGAMLFGANQPTPATSQNRIVLIKPSIGTTGQRDSDAILWEGKANAGTDLAVWWRQYVDVTSNAGASTFTWQQNLNGAGWTTRATLTDAGLFTVANLTLSAITGSTQCLNVNTSGVVSGTGSTCGGGSGSVTSVATTSPITGGTITTTGTIACATCVTSASALTANALVIGSGLQATAITTTGTGVLTALGINVGSAGAFVTFNGAGGTPSSMIGTNITGTASGLTAGSVTTNANLTGPVTSTGNATTIGANQVSRANEAQGVARSVIGVAGNATANVADIQGTSNQFLGVNNAGTALAFNTLSQDCALVTGVITCTKTNNVAFGPAATALVGQIPGTATNDNAASGDVGEYKEATCPIQTTTITVTIASPAVVTWTAHGYLNTTINIDTCPITFTTSGALPTGITAGTAYWVVPSSITTNTFQIATSVANALAGTSVNTSGTQSGTQTGTATVPITNAGNFTVTGLNLTAGDWECRTLLIDAPAGTTVVTLVTAGVSQVNNALPNVTLHGAPAYGNTAGSSTGTARVASTGPGRYLNSTTTPTYAIINAAFTVSTDAGWGNLACRRIR